MVFWERPHDPAEQPLPSRSSQGIRFVGCCCAGGGRHFGSAACLTPGQAI